MGTHQKVVSSTGPQSLTSGILFLPEEPLDPFWPFKPCKPFRPGDPGGPETHHKLLNCRKEGGDPLAKSWPPPTGTAYQGSLHLRESH